MSNKTVTTPTKAQKQEFPQTPDKFQIVKEQIQKNQLTVLDLSCKISFFNIFS